MGFPLFLHSKPEPHHWRKVFFPTWRLIFLQAKLIFITEESAYLIGLLVRESPSLALLQEGSWG